MDSVRFGRALGFGARSAAKALAGAVDAATATNPTPVKQSPAPAPQSTAAPGPARSRSSDAVATAARGAAYATVQAQVRARETGKSVARGGKRFGESFLGPLAKLSKVLWLEMTGAFFGIFAVFAGQAAWSHRADLHPTPPNHQAHMHALVFLTMATVFAYFCISSFVRAYRK